jgi:ribosomal-protein-alanine N-acetyltransferase
MLQLQFDPYPTIHTDRLAMRCMTLADAPEMFYLRSHPRVMQYLDRAPCKDLTEAENKIKEILELQANNDGINWAINVKPSTEMIGNIGIWRLQKEHFRGEIGYVLHPDYHRQGLMSEAMAEVINYAFHTMGLHSLEANVNPENSASIALLEKHGFVREAYFRENYFWDGKFLDSAIYSLVNKS